VAVSRLAAVAAAMAVAARFFPAAEAATKLPQCAYRLMAIAIIKLKTMDTQM
jgi:hypothetical protein